MKKLCVILFACVLMNSFLPQTALAAVSTDFEQEFTTYLTEKSNERGLTVIKGNVEEALARYYLSLEDFETVQEMSDFLGDVIKSDLSNMNDIYNRYHITEAELSQLLMDHGETINDYIYLNDLESSVSFYQSSSDLQNSTSEISNYIKQILPVILAKIDLSNSEIEQLKKHYASIEENLSSTEFQIKYAALDSRMNDLRLAALKGEKSEEEIASEMASIYEDFLPLLKLNVIITLKQDGKDTVLSLADLFRMDKINDKATIYFALYNDESKFLADFSLSDKIFESILEGEQTENATDDVIKSIDKASSGQNSGIAKTVNGAKLPKTASYNFIYVISGIIIVIAGLLMYRKVRKGNVEFIKQEEA